MSSAIETGMWCAVQTTLIALIGLGASYILARRRPAAGASVAALAAVAILAATALIPWQVPELVSRPVRTALAMSQTSEFSDANGQSSPSPPPRASVVGPSTRLPVRPDLLLQLARFDDHLKRGGAGHSVLGWIGALLAVGAAAAAVRLALAWTRLKRLGRMCVPIRDSAPLTEMTQIARSLGCVRIVELQECAAMTTAALFGWRRPMVVLPIQWRQWSATERQAVLAHELSHAARNDAIWRLIATLAATVHFYNPLVHWMTRRLTLAQEFAADAAAARVVGGKRAYLTALSQLALRRDGRVSPLANLALAPTFSSRLIRRINMLQAMECNHARWAWQAVHGAAVALVAATLVVSTAIRGAAEHESAESTTPTGEAQRDANQVAPPTDVEASSLFRRTPFDVSRFGDNDSGAFVVRVAELLSQPELRPLAAILNAGAKASWEHVSSATPSPDFQFEQIEYIAGLAQMTLKFAAEDENNKEQGQVMFGSSEVEIRFTGDVAWRKWIRRHLPASEEVADGDFTYVELPHMPALGPARVYVTERDARTIVCAHSIERLKRLATHQTRAVASDLATVWSDLDGGLLTLVVTDKSIEAPEGTPKEEARRLVHEIGASTDMFGIAYDVAKESGQIGVRVRMACEDEATAARVDKATDGLVAHAISSLRAVATTPDDGQSGAAQQGDDRPDMSPAAAKTFATLLEHCRKRGGRMNAAGKFEVGFDVGPIPLREVIANLSSGGSESTVRK